ncbi:unnamed protein product, partial [Rotaria sp. Silwood2]
MMLSIARYWSSYAVLRKLLHSIELMQAIDREISYFLNLRDSNNLEYFLSLFRSVKRDIDPYHILLSTMGCALIIDILLIATAVINVIIYGQSTDLLIIWCLIDIVILSFFIIIFLGIVSLINKLLIHDSIRYLKNLKTTTVTTAIIHEHRNENAH